MQVLQPIAKNFLKIFGRKETITDRNEYILYKIVDSCNRNNEEQFKIQCINTNAIFSISLQEIIFDIDILYGLHPVQSCFIGIEYSKVKLAAGIRSPSFQDRQNTLNQYPIHRYGNNKLLYQDRYGNLGFEERANNSQFLMDPRDIALSQVLIEEFDAAQAFFIGISAGMKFQKIPANKKMERKNNSHLKLVEK